jgi:hypothetical protein
MPNGWISLARVRERLNAVAAEFLIVEIPDQHGYGVIHAATPSDAVFGPADRSACDDWIQEKLLYLVAESTIEFELDRSVGPLQVHESEPSGLYQGVHA